MATARHIPFNEQLADMICDALSCSHKGLAGILEEIGADISPSLVYKWIQQYPEFRERYARARSEQAQLLADQIQEIADKEPEFCEMPTKHGSYQAVDRGYLEWHRQRIEARKWLAAKLLPKVYGDKTALTGPDGGAIQIVSTIPRPGKVDSDGTV